MPWPAGPDAAALLGLAALVLIVFREAVFGGGVFYERDIHIVGHEQVEVLLRSVASGSWPVWDPFNGFGQPYLANPNTQVFYPTTWLHFLIRPWTYYTLFFVAHLAFSATGLYVLGRHLGISRGGAFTAAAIWATSGPLLSFVNVWPHFAGSVWIPWVLLGADDATRSERASRAVLWGAAMALQVLAGSPDMCAFTQLLVVAFAVRRLEWRRSWFSDNRRLLSQAALAWIVALGLSAAQWMPTLETAMGTARIELNPAKRTFWSVHPLAMIQVLFPLDFDDLPRYAPQAAPLFDLWSPFIHSLYLGLPALGLVAAAFASPQRAHRRFFTLTAVAAVLFALGRYTPAYGLIVEVLRPLRILRYPAKTMVFTAFSGAVVAGMGFDVWREAIPSRRRWSLLVAGMATVTAVALAAALWRSQAAQRWGPLLLSRLPLTAGLAAAALAAALLRWRSARDAPRHAAAVAALAVVDLLAAHSGLNPTTRKEFFTYRPEILKLIPTEPPARIYVWDYVMRPPGVPPRSPNRVPVFYENPEGWPPGVGSAMAMQMYLYPPSQGRWGLLGSYNPDLLDLGGRALYDMNLLLRSVEGTPAYTRLLRMGSVDYVVSLHEEGLDDLMPVATLPGLYSQPIRVFRVPDPLPRAYAVGAARTADGKEALRTVLDDAFDPRREVILSRGASPPASPAFAGTSRILQSRPDRVRLEASLSEPGYVVLVDGFEAGWRATVDGRPSEVLRANLIFRAVRVPGGRHVIEYVYRPTGVLLGVAVSAATLLLVVGVGLRSLLR